MTEQKTWADRTFVAFSMLILVFLILPTLLIIPMSVSPSSYLKFPPDGFSLRWYTAFFSDSAWISATLFSLQIAFATAICATVVGTMAAIALVRGGLPGRSTIEALVLAPLIVPHIIVAIAVYLQFAPLGLTGTRLGFVLIHTALAVPYVVLLISAALQRLSPSLEMAALNLGASRLTAFRTITLPLILPAVSASLIFAFLASFDETIVSFFISGVEHKTITRKLFEDIEFSLSPIIAAASTVFVTVTVGMMWIGNLTKSASQKAVGGDRDA
ncbi:MAG: attB [Cereibacter sp.]|jgi:mannopine transport system permease protein|nr:attB [Cereibacter sp.]